MLEQVNEGQIATQGTGELPVNQGLLDSLDSAAEEFSETLGKDDMSIPFLQILQALSPQCTRGDPAFIKAAEPSMIFNTVTREMFPTQDDNGNALVGLKVISLSYMAAYVEWVVREKGGGFVRQHTVAEGQKIRTHRDDMNRDIILEGNDIGTPGNQLAYTHTHFVGVLREGADNMEPAVITMQSTGVKSSKDWNALIDRLRLPNGKRAPRFFGVWSASTRRRVNESGSWYLWDFSLDTDLLALNNSELLRDCAEFARSVSDGEQSVNYDKANPETSSAPAGSGDDGFSEEESDGEIPF